MLFTDHISFVISILSEKSQKLQQDGGICQVITVRQ